MAKRLLPDSEKALYKATEVVDVNTWPSELPPEFGKSDVCVLYCKYSLPYFCELKTEYRDYKESGGATKLILIKYLVNRINTVLVSMAECEHEFKQDEHCVHSFPYMINRFSLIIPYVYFNLLLH